jgi:hypothetical protein
MVSVWLAGIKAPDATVIEGLPTVVSLKKKLPDPPAIPTEVTEPSKAPVPLTSNRMVREEEERLAVPTKVDTRLLN